MHSCDLLCALIIYPGLIAENVPFLGAGYFYLSLVSFGLNGWLLLRKRK